MAATAPEVAIIGAGLSGLCLALALHGQGVACTVYESRPAPLNIGGAVMLSPNALRILDALEVYPQVKMQGYNFDELHFRDVGGNLLETYEFGGQDKYGYRGLRIYRHILIDTLLAALKKKTIPVQFGRKFSHVVSEDKTGVTFAFTDDTKTTASLLVGADGIHSTVRKYLYPDLEPRFIGMAGITAAVPTAQLKLPPGYHVPVTIGSPVHGAFVIAPQEPDGSEVLIGKQRRFAEAHLDREALDRLQTDKEASVRFLQQDAAHFGPVVENAVSSIPTDKINVWPFFVVPRLDTWASAERKVVILGDAAHAIPPSAGQGINQAFEDVYMFAMLLGRAVQLGDGGLDQMTGALEFWQSYRQERIDKILKLNQQIDIRRMPAGDDMLKDVKKEPFELSWLYKPDFRADVEDWVAQLKNP
jgi:2-polyprenyl-6-methoxyphenol hydroxylase-like FAD-dependent oxidoreductase